MTELPSVEFRKTYTSLTEPTVVTVLGRPIGIWTPVNLAIDDRALSGLRPGEPVEPDRFGSPRAAPKPVARVKAASRGLRR